MNFRIATLLKMQETYMNLFGNIIHVSLIKGRSKNIVKERIPQGNQLRYQMTLKTNFKTNKSAYVPNQSATNQIIQPIIRCIII